ncbi:MAG: histidinol dehydrogenase, partial [Gemmatimonadaceae bacterium]
AAELAGVDRVFAAGGAGAIAAMAYGTDSIPRVARIVGPGNAYVAEAKLQVSAVVGIDSPAGPSELLVIAGDGSDPERVALELLAQAEHDPLACVVAVTLGAELQAAVLDAVRRALAAQPRRDIIARALESRGAVLRATSLREAIDFANRYAPEHLLLAVRDPRAVLGEVRNAGTVFLGDSSSVPFGDYMTGANHVLPTGAMARTYSGLSVLDFMRWTTYQHVTPAAAARLAGDVALFAESEGLPAHAAAARVWEEVAPGAAQPSALGSSPFAGSRPSPLTPRTSTFRAAYRSISLYAPDRAPCAVDLSDNTNLWGVPPAAAAAIRDTPVPSVTRYPPLYAAELKQELAAYAGVSPEEIVTGCGSDDVLDSALRAFAEPGEQVAYPDPSFAMVPLFARMNGLEGVAAPLTTDFDIDAAALLATGARVIYVCSPNNPTGALASRAALDEVIAAAPGVVILDQAYAEFAGDAAPRPEVRDHLLVVRTMSKAFGLAGLRIGYAVGPGDLVAEVEKSRGPYKVSGVAERAALAALRHDMTWVRERVAEVRENRARLASELAALGLAPLPSDANFLLVPVSGAAALTARMRAAGVAVRPFTALPGIGDAVRITVGPWPMMRAALTTLQECASLATPGGEAR